MADRPPADLVGRSPRLVYVIGTYPSLTTTFIDREIELLRRWGLSVRVTSIRRPGHALSPSQQVLQGSVRYVLPVPVLGLLVSHLRWAVTRPRTYVDVFVQLVGRPHPSVRARLRTLLHVGMAIHAARLVRQGGDVDHVHAHFVDRATTVAMVVSRLLGLPCSATAHANDIYVDPVLLPEKLAGARFVATCTRYNAEHLAAIAGPAVSRIVCVHHGLDLEAYQPRSSADADTSEPDSGAGPQVPTILSVAQLRPKKGLLDLVEACSTLRDRGYAVACDIVGEGPSRAELTRRIEERGLTGVVRLLGALDHPTVVEHYRNAAIFALPCVTAPDGDRDGIPNVILEAMAMELPVVSTRHSGVPEAVEDGGSGVLVPPGDAAALADAIAGLLDSPAARRRLGRRGRQIVLESFDIEQNTRRLVRAFSEVEVPRG